MNIGQMLKNTMVTVEPTFNEVVFEYFVDNTTDSFNKFDYSKFRKTLNEVMETKNLSHDVMAEQMKVSNLKLKKWLKGSEFSVPSDKQLQHLFNLKFN